MSLYLRLSLLVVTMTLLAMALFAFLEYTLFTRSQRVQLELVLERDLARAQSLLSNPLLGANLSELNEGSFVQQFVNRDGLVIIPPTSQTALPDTTGASIKNVNGTYMLVSKAPWLSQTGTVLGDIRVALNVDAAMRARTALRRNLFISSISIAIIVILTGLWLLRRTLTPLRKLASEASQLDPANPKLASYVGPDDEVADLAKALNTTLDAIRQRQQAERTSLAEIAHELSAPLSLVSGHLQSLQKQLNDPRLEAAQDAADELLYTSQDLLTLARGELERPLDFVICDLTNVLKKVARAYPEVQLIHLDTAPIAGNPDRLIQLFRNLVRNAVQASADERKIWLELSESVHTYQVKVKDNGAGIAPQDLATIFEHFFTKRGGVGVGLSVAKRIAEQHKGKISVESALGKGATFTVSLPKLTLETD